MAKALEPLKLRVKIIERDRDCARRLSADFPNFLIIHGDVTDLQLLKAERIALDQTFVALSGNDESNLMSCLLAQELGVPQVLAMVHRAETMTSMT